MTARLVQLATQETFSSVRDRIAEILVVELAGQRAIAAEDAGKYDFRVFTERANPLGEWDFDEDPEDATLDRRPTINVTFETANIVRQSTGSIQTAAFTQLVNVDCYALGIGKAVTGGHQPADETAGREALRVAEIALRLLGAATYHLLQMQGVVKARRFLSVVSYQPTIDDRAVQRVRAVRLAVEVDLRLETEQAEGEPVEEFAIKTRRTADGEVFAEVGFKFTEDEEPEDEESEGEPEDEE